VTNIIKVLLNYFHVNEFNPTLSEIHVAGFECVTVDFDGLFVSNGPGNPETCMKTVEQLRLVLAREPAKPVFGICLGHQLLSLAAGATTYKMKLVPLLPYLADCLLAK